MLPQCPECEAVIEVDQLDVDRGEIISCPECGADLHVRAISPVEFDVAYALGGIMKVAGKDV